MHYNGSIQNILNKLSEYPCPHCGDVFDLTNRLAKDDPIGGEREGFIPEFGETFVAYDISCPHCGKMMQVDLTASLIGVYIRPMDDNLEDEQYSIGDDTSPKEDD